MRNAQRSLTEISNELSYAHHALQLTCDPPRVRFVPETKSMQEFKFIDLFAGIGGFHHALGAIGGECVLTCEIDSACQQTYRSSFKLSMSHTFVENIRTLTREDVNDETSVRTAKAIDRRVPDHDVLCAGFPCQPFSKSGAQ